MDHQFTDEELAAYEINNCAIDEEYYLKDRKNSLGNTSNGASAIKALSIPYNPIDCHTFFSYRNEVIKKAIADCQRDIMSPFEVQKFIGAWFLTEISLWDTEKERLVLLTKNFIYSVKYDLISLNIMDYENAFLEDIDTLILGELVYPPKSIFPCLNGLANGISSLINSALHQDWPSLTSFSGSSNFRPRSRNALGLRLMWNDGKPLPMDTKWNPFALHIPMFTFANHPLFYLSGPDSDKSKYDVYTLHLAIRDLMTERCQQFEKPIIIENYFGLGSLVHNRIDLGFFKIRGKISF